MHRAASPVSCLLGKYLMILVLSMVVVSTSLINALYVKQLSYVGAELRGEYSNISLPYIGEPLSSLLGAKLFYAPITEGSKDPNLCYDFPGDCIEANFRALIGKYNCDCRNVTGEDLYRDDTRGLEVLIASSKACRIVITNMNYLALKYGDGVVHYAYLLNETEVNNTMDYLELTVQYYMNGFVFSVLYNAGINASLLYAGLFGENATVVYEYEYEAVENVLSPVNKTYVKIENPHHRFYVLFNGIRYVYPIILGIENVDGKPLLKNAKFFLPELDFPLEPEVSVNGYARYVLDEEAVKRLAAKYTFIINESYLDKIMDVIRNEAGLNASTLDDVVIADIYYAPTTDYKYLYPYLEVYVRNTDEFKDLVRIVLMKNEPKLDSVLTVAGEPDIYDPPYILIEKDIHSLIERQRALNEVYRGIAIVVGIALVTSIVFSIKKFIIPLIKHH